MYKNVGSAIRIIAKTLFWIGVSISVIAAIALIYNGTKSHYGNSELIGIGFVVLIFGPVIFWLANLFLYAFGELVQNTTDINNKLGGNIPTASTYSNPQSAPQNTPPVNTQQNWSCANCGAQNIATAKYCSKCGAFH